MSSNENVRAIAITWRLHGFWRNSVKSVWRPIHIISHCIIHWMADECSPAKMSTAFCVRRESDPLNRLSYQRRIAHRTQFIRTSHTVYRFCWLSLISPEVSIICGNDSNTMKIEMHWQWNQLNSIAEQKYWAKDIIFVVTDQEQLGMQAWLEAYHGSDVCNAMHVLDCGTLHARAGSIQAAINLEFSSFDLSYIDVKIEGLNGQLPNLDLVNLIQRLAMKEGIVSGHKQTNDRKRSGAKSTWAQNFHHMISMVLTQSSGVPNGNHGLFFRYGIQAVTLEGHKREQTNYQRKAQGATAILKLVEGIARSVNNLLERFHQSFFFYLLVASDRYVSIGDYMPSLGLMAAALLIKAFIVWLKVNQKTSRAEAGDSDCSTSTVKECDTLQNYSFISVGRFIIVAHAFGVLAAYLPFATPLTEIFHQYGIKTEVYLFASLWILSVIGSMVSLLMSFNKENIEVIRCPIATAQHLTNFSIKWPDSSHRGSSWDRHRTHHFGRIEFFAWITIGGVRCAVRHLGPAEWKSIHTAVNIPTQ